MLLLKTGLVTFCDSDGMVVAICVGDCEDACTVDDVDDCVGPCDGRFSLETVTAGVRVVIFWIGRFVDVLGSVDGALLL